MKRPISKTGKAHLLKSLLIAVTIVLAVELPYQLIVHKLIGIGEEAAVGVFQIVISAIGALFVVFELRSSYHVNCCDSLSDLNFRFIENPRLMLLYQRLGECFKDPDKQLEVIDDADDSHVHSADLMAYLTFYEVLYENIQHGMMDIEQMDDLFGDRFFKIMHNNYVQENELYAEPSSYSNIFGLYTLWYEHRVKTAEKQGKRLMAMPENAIPEMYLKKKLYLHESHYLAPDKGLHTFTNSHNQTIQLRQKRLYPRNLKDILALQKEVNDAIADVDIFKYSSEEELLESMLIDYCYGLFDGKKLVAICLGVANRESSRNLCNLLGDANHSAYVTFDTIQVKKDYRGFGIQAFFLKDFEKYAAELKRAQSLANICVLATVSPKNPYSLTNFEKFNYTHGDPVEAYGSKRYLVKKNIEQEEAE